MLRFKLNTLFHFTMAMTLVCSVPAVAQDCSTGTCPLPSATSDTNYRFSIGQMRYDNPVVIEDRFPEFREFRSDYQPTRDYQPVRSRNNVPVRTRQPLRSYDDFGFGHSIDSRRPAARSSRDAEWQRYHDEWNARYPDTGRRRVQPVRRSRDFHYSGYGRGDFDIRRRPAEDRFYIPRDIDSEFGTSRDRFDQQPAGPVRDRYLPTPDRDRYLPATDRDRYFPDTDRDRYESEPVRRSEPTLDDKITARYADPNAVRFARSLSGNQGLVLFREVSQLIDTRHLSPRSYSERIRRGTESLKTALNNQSFRSAVQLSASSGQVRNFASQLDQVTSRGVRNRTEAEQVLRSVMQFGSQSLGLRPGVIAYEFTNASIESLDKYSALEPSLQRVSGQVDDSGMQTAMSGLDEYVTGIGVEVREHREGLEIVKTLRGGPAGDAGILAGDVIRQVDGRNIGGTKMASSVAMISGQSGTQIRLLIARESRGTKVFTLVRRRFRVYSVNDVKMIDSSQGVGYLRLTKFARSSADEMEQAIRDLRSQGMKSLVVDVRGNPGGLLTTAIEISDKFLRCGRIVATRGRLSTDNSVETANATGTWGMPLVVLADGDSASASEIFAAAIQENSRGIVIGERTYGKGTVQTHFPLASRLGTLRLTTAKFYSPKDREMAGSGVTPDVRSADEKEAMERAIVAATHPRLAEMVAEHGTCRPSSPGHQHPDSAATPAAALSASLK